MENTGTCHMLKMLIPQVADLPDYTDGVVWLRNQDLPLCLMERQPTSRLSDAFGFLRSAWNFSTHPSRKLPYQSMQTNNNKTKNNKLERQPLIHRSLRISVSTIFDNLSLNWSKAATIYRDWGFECKNRMKNKHLAKDIANCALTRSENS